LIHLVRIIIQVYAKSISAKFHIIYRKLAVYPIVGQLLAEKELMKIKYPFITLLVVFVLASCAPAATIAPATSTPSNDVSQTKNDITLAITNVSFSETQTVVTFVVKVSPQWGLDINAFPPQQALHNNPILTDETGRQYHLISGTYGLPQFGTETGGVTFENTVTFEPIKSQNLIFQVEIEISELPISQPVLISISDHKVLDVWVITQGITFSNFTDVQGNVKLLSQSDKNLELEFTFNRVTSGGLKLGCLNFYPDGQDLANTQEVVRYQTCAIDEKQVISTVGMDLPADKALPISFHVTGGVAFTEPFIVLWSVNEK
jgi:hypothetical protein